MFAPSNRIVPSLLVSLNLGSLFTSVLTALLTALAPLTWVLVGLAAGGWVVALSRAFQLVAGLRAPLRAARGKVAPPWTSTSRRISR